MASSDLVELLSKLQAPQRPTSLAFEMDNPYATLASVGPAYAQRGSDISNALMMSQIRSQIQGMIPDQRKHEILMEGVKQAEKGGAAIAQILSQGGYDAGALDAEANLGKTQAETTAKLAGATADLSKTPYYLTPTAQIIRDQMGLDPGVAQTLPSIASASAGNPGSQTAKLVIETIEQGPDGRPIKVKREAGEKAPGRSDAIQSDREAQPQRGRQGQTSMQSPPPQVTPSLDTTVSQGTTIRSKKDGQDYQMIDKGDKWLIVAPDGKSSLIPKSRIEAK